MWQLHEGMFFLFRKRLCWSLSDTYVMFMNSERYFFVPFFDVFCAEVHPVRRQKSSHVYNVGITNDVNVNPMSENDEVRLLGLNLGLSRDVCEPMVGSAVKDSWWTNQEGFFCPLSRKTRRLQWLFYFNALSLPNHVCIYICSAAKIHSF